MAATWPNTSVRPGWSSCPATRCCGGTSPDLVLGVVEEFLVGARHSVEPTRVLATVLFTDIVGSTRRAAELGDRRWRELLDVHDQLAGRLVGQWGGRLVKTTGDGVLATFDGPGRAIGCAAALWDELGEIGVHVRAGLHIGEVELRGDDVGGIAVHIAAGHGHRRRRRDRRVPDCP